jgi:hypothetical protein
MLATEQADQKRMDQMKASEMVEELQQRIERQGDFEVFLYIVGPMPTGGNTYPPEIFLNDQDRGNPWIGIKPGAATLRPVAP